MEALVLAPLREIAGRPGGPNLRGVIIIDGLDECEAEQYHDTTSTGPRAKLARTSAQDQLEILRVLQTAAVDPLFPFRILIASRPERVFREFFDPEKDPTSFARKLDLHEDYNANADITLFLEAQFNQIRRRYQLSLSWPPPGAIETLVENASGQFVYAATVIRFLDMGHREPPKALLEAILKVQVTKKPASNPLEQLDALYTHILESSPDPPLSVRWIRSIHSIHDANHMNARHLVASNINLLLQTDPESSEVEHLLGNLHSLVRIPTPSNQAVAKYDFYHKSLFDYLGDPHRCGKLHVEWSDVRVFIWNAFVRACARGCDTQFSSPQSFLEFLICLPSLRNMASSSAHSEILPIPAGADWWASLAIADADCFRYLWAMFKEVHRFVRAVLNLFQTLN
ncbi:hypothetical protein EST38_g9895 [Candolleomyces aberdarensis]|uniref:NACHT domain-containing protein n=1 Tax=Candolleomyces aberdarensis TaxID=2316362 RepID=A0A4Q2D8T4_9AGAR|nr:hypothetical protein EST38_g9895 [Candolleomyces aberdarensis]